MKTNRNTKLYLAALTITMLTFLSACQLPSNTAQLEQPHFSEARLNHQTGEIVLPLDQYVISTHENNSRYSELYQKASNVALTECMAENGVTYEPYDPDFKIQTKQTTRYGVWNLEQARTYGFEDNPITDEERTKLEEEAKKRDEKYSQEQRDEAYYKAAEECRQKAQETVRSVMNIEDFQEMNENHAVIIDLAEQARKNALAEPDWKQARSVWDECIIKEGLNPMQNQIDEDYINIYGGLGITSQEAQEILGHGYRNNDETTTTYDSFRNKKDEEIRIALIEAQCNIDTELSQKLANIEAAEQQKIINDNQETFTQEKTIHQRISTKLEDFIAQAGTNN